MTASSATATSLAFAFVLAGSIARAEPSAREAIAEALFRSGQTLLEAGQVDEACEKLAESHRIEPALGTLLNLAVCHERQGRTATAWAELAQAAARAAQRGQPDRERFAQERMRVLEPRLSKLRLEPPAGELPTVAIDGEPVSAWSTPLPLDPGEHTISVSAPGKRPRTSTVSLPAGPTLLTLRIEALEIDAPPAASTPPPGAISPRPTPASRLAGYVALGLGGVALGVGAAFGVRAFALKGDVDSHCREDVCDPRGMEAQAHAHDAATAATIAFVAGAVLAVTGGVLLVVTPADGGGTVTTVARW